MLVTIYLYSIIIICFVFCIILYIMTKQKLYTYENIKLSAEIQDMSNGQPLIYELIYISNDQNTGIWQFSKTRSIKNDIDIAIKHFKDGKINFFIIKNNLYRIEKLVKESYNICEMILSNACVTDLSFVKPCSNLLSTSLTNTTFNAIHVLGYNF